MLSVEDTMHEMTVGVFYSRDVKISIEGMKDILSGIC
jgi:hypothetical protein